MRSAFGVALGVLSIVVGLVATLLSLKPIMLGLYLAVVGLWPVLLAVLAALLLLLVPGGCGLAAVVVSLRRPSSYAGIVLGSLGVVVGCVAGPAFYAGGEQLKPSAPPKAARPASCAVKTADTSAINRPCTAPGFAQGECPASYSCADTMAGLTGDKSKPARVCEVLCVHDCECPSGTTCRNATCQRGKDLPP